MLKCKVLMFLGIIHKKGISYLNIEINIDKINITMNVCVGLPPWIGRDCLPSLCGSFYIHQQGLVSRKCSGQSSTMHQEDLAWFSLSVHFSITVFANWNYKYLKYSYLCIEKTKCGKCEIQQMTKFKLFGLLERKFKLFELF